MATRQYIGARYVPKFYDYNGSPNWRAGVEYEALTIVTRNSNSYTSKKPVPSSVGEPENNPEYWVATGLYNEQVEAYRQLTLALSERVGDVETDLGDVETNLVAETETRTSEIATINETLNKILGVGESNILVVAKNNARFHTVNDAIDYAKTYCSATNRVTIMIVNCGEIYNEYIDLDSNPGIDFYGIGTPSIRSSVAWRLSTIRCSNAITCYNIIFENYYTPAEGEHAGYGLHADPVTGIQNYIRCTFRSDNNAGVGIGMGDRGSINFYDCSFYSGVESVYIHNSSVNGTVGQWARFYRCHFEANANALACVRVYDAATAVNPSYTSSMAMIFSHCSAFPNTKVSYTYNGNQTVPYLPSQSRPITQVASHNIFITKSSVGSDVLGLDYYRNVLSYTYRFISTSNIHPLIMPNCERYTITKDTVEWSDDSGATWHTHEGVSFGIVADEPYPNNLRLTGGILTPNRWFSTIFKCVYKE